MKKPTIAVTGPRKGKLADGYNWKLDNLVFDKEEKRGKRNAKTSNVH